MTPYIYAGVAKNKITPEYVVEKTAEKMNVPVEEVRTKTRKREITDCRHTIAFFIAKGLRRTTILAGFMVGRDHSTVTFSCNRVLVRYQVDKKYRETIHALARMFMVDLADIEGMRPMKVRKFIDGEYFCSNCHQYSDDQYICTKCRQRMM